MQSSLSVRCFHHCNGCSFLADNQGSFLTFPKFVLPVDDSSDCTIFGSGHTSTLHFDSRTVGSVVPVSDNTRHRHRRRPPISSSSSLPTTKPPSLVPSPIDLPITITVPLPPISEEDTTSLLHPSSPSTHEDALLSTLHELNLCPSYVTSSGLSTTQSDEIIKAVTSHLKKNGRITMELLHFIRDGFSSPCNSTSTTTPGHPILLSSEKIANTAPSHCWFTTQQSSRYYSFHSFKNWDTLHNVCLPNFSFI